MAKVKKEFAKIPIWQCFDEIGFLILDRRLRVKEIHILINPGTQLKISRENLKLYGIDSIKGFINIAPAGHKEKFVRIKELSKFGYELVD